MVFVVLCVGCKSGIQSRNGFRGKWLWRQLRTPRKIAGRLDHKRLHLNTWIQGELVRPPPRRFRSAGWICLAALIVEIPSPNRIISNDRVVIPASVSIVCRWFPPQLVSQFSAELAWPRCQRCGCKVLTCSLYVSVCIGFDRWKWIRFDVPRSRM